MGSFRAVALAALFAGCTPFSASDAPGSDGGGSSDAPADGPADAAVTGDAPSSAYADSVLAAKPLLYWRLGEKSGNFEDRSGHSHPGIPAGALIRGAPSLLASDGDLSVRIGGGASIAAQPAVELDFPGNAPYTLELWIRIDVAPAGGPDILTIAEGGSGIGLSFEGNTTKILSSRFEPGRGAAHGSRLLTLKVPHHVVTTYDGQALRLYLDGALASDNDLTKTPASLDAHTYAATIGTKPGGGALDGLVDEVAIYDYALSQSLITEHHMLGSKL